MTLSWAMLAPGLAILIAGFGVAARRLDVPSSIVMLGAGALLSLSGVWPGLALDPEIILTWLLPPLLYASGVGMSWRGFRSNLRPILLLAIGCVLFSTVAVAAVAYWAFGLPLAVAFILGAIVSPPDAVAPMAIVRRLRLPRRIVTILEGESLVNDATALVTLMLAIQATRTGGFSPTEAIVRFAAITGGELAWGMAIGWATLRLRHLADDPRAEVLLALATPFIAFWPPHALHGSGVVACVAAGLWVSWNGRDLIRPATRLQGYFIWDLVTWSVEALVFLLTGLQARMVLDALGANGLERGLALGLLTTLAVIVTRFVWVFPAAYLPRMIPAIRARDPYPNWRTPALIGFIGLRGVVSLAAALTVPLATPGRDLILFATFTVIVLTLVGEGTVLPRVVRLLGLEESGRKELFANRRDERQVRIEGVDAVLRALGVAERRGADKGAVDTLIAHHRRRRDHLLRSADRDTPDDPVTEVGRLEEEMLKAERRTVAKAYVENRLTDEARRRIERELDLEEARLSDQVASGGAEDRSPPG